jgi:formylmethanofuran dehydrogenase subunit A
MVRELTLNEIAIMTRAGPARLLGLRDRGHLGEGAAADVAVYRAQADAEAMFATPEWVFKDGLAVVRGGRIVATPTGAVHFAEVEFDPGIERTIAAHTERPLGIANRYSVIGHDELCGCCNGGRLLPSACTGRSV